MARKFGFGPTSDEALFESEWIIDTFEDGGRDPKYFLIIIG